MNIAKGIFGRDLEHMARNGAAPLIGRGSTNPSVIAEANFIVEHGMSRAQHADRLAAMRAEDRRADAIRDLSGEPPQFPGLGNLRPAQKLWARFFYWRQGELKKLHDLEVKEAELRWMIEAPGAAETEIRNGIRRTVAKLMGRANDGGESDAGALANKLAIAQHNAEAAKVALPEIERQIERQQQRVEAIDDRESDFLNAVMIEKADDAGLGRLYLRKLSELNEVAAMVFGLAAVAGGYGSGLSRPEAHIKFPLADGLPSIKSTKESDYVIKKDGDSHIWNNLAQALRLDPKHNGFIPLPK